MPDRRIWMFVAAGGALLWRVAALRWPSSFVSLPDGLRLPLALLGVLFLGCGVWAHWARPGRWTNVFLFYGLGGAVHWGGAIGSTHPGVEQSLFFLYLAFTALADAALLHLALIYPTGAFLHRGTRILLYGPAALAALLAPAAGIVPPGMLQVIAGALLLIANLLSLVAGVGFVVRSFTVDPATRRAAKLGMVAAAMASGSVLALLGAGGVLPGPPEAWNLALGVIPIGLAIAVATHSLQPTVS